MEVLQLVAQGMTNKAIALRLSISEHTVKFHVNSILGKLNAHSRAEAVTIGTRLGLVRL
jgi:DNA-binding NarL/FixJ family response regulator